MIHLARESMEEYQVAETSKCTFRTRYVGTFTLYGFRTIPDEDEVLVLTLGDLTSVESPLVRVHSRCLTGDVFGSVLCDCKEQLDVALERIQSEGTGVLIYLEQEGRGNGLLAKLRAYELMESGLDTVEANEKLGIPQDNRSYKAAAYILKHFGIERIRLLTNNPDKIVQISSFGLNVVREPLLVTPNPWNKDYLNTKKSRLGHLLDL
jgi:3,4-dihydroxy 2-butanone 4-phosphate synthase/GTP cyclohydrolase II